MKTWSTSDESRLHSTESADSTLKTDDRLNRLTQLSPTLSTQLDSNVKRSTRSIDSIDFRVYSYSIHFFTQSLSSFRNTCPYHRSLFCCSTENMSSNSSLPLNSLLGTLSCNFTPHIHLTILISALGSATSFSFLTGQVLWLPLDRTMTLVAYKSHNGQRRYPAETLSRG